MGQFQLDIQKFAAKQAERLSVTPRRIVLELATRIIVKSPVDTGRFRSSWRVSPGGIDPSVAPEIVKALEPDAKARATGMAAYRPLSGEEREAVYARINANPGARVWFISNSLPYARRLEYGWSGQAPYGMVRASMMEMDGPVNEAALAELGAPL